MVRRALQNIKRVGRLNEENKRKEVRDSSSHYVMQPTQPNKVRRRRSPSIPILQQELARAEGRAHTTYGRLKETSRFIISQGLLIDFIADGKSRLNCLGIIFLFSSDQEQRKLAFDSQRTATFGSDAARTSGWSGA